MTAKTRFKRHSGFVAPPAPAPLPTFEARQPPSGALINAILQYADIQQPLGGGRYNLRLSPKRMKDPVIKGLLGREARRLAEVSVFWNDEEGEIIQVLDTAAAPDPTPEFEDLSELDSFELTEVALEYVAKYQAAK